MCKLSLKGSTLLEIARHPMLPPSIRDDGVKPQVKCAVGSCGFSFFLLSLSPSSPACGYVSYMMRIGLVLVPVEPASAYWQQEYCTLAARILLAGSKTFARWQQDKFLTGINADHTSRTECKWSRNPKWGFVILKCMDVSTFPSWDVLVLHANVYNLDILDFI